jgi:hypothetical protein
MSGAADRAAPNAVPLHARLESLAEMPTPELREVWQQTRGALPPKGARRRFLMLGIAWQWQADVLGGFRPEMVRRLAVLEGRADRSASLDAVDAANAARPGPGTRLVRVWRGERHEVHVTERGYLWRGRSFGSLSSVAGAITGVSRNGPKFFGLRDQKRSA